jgi:hypothetical protein
MCIYLLSRRLMYPPRIHFFLWLLSNNNLLTRDNLEKRKKIDDLTCLFCTERESIQHLFFDCVIVKRTWELVSQAIGVHIVKDLESVAKLWICNKKCYIVNIVTSAVCWSL